MAKRPALVDQAARKIDLARKRALDKAEQQRRAALVEHAQVLAIKKVAWDHRDEVLRGLLGRLSQARVRALHEEAEVLSDQFIEALESGATFGDENYASIARPPVLPLEKNVNYEWSERGFTIAVDHRHCLASDSGGSAVVRVRDASVADWGSDPRLRLQYRVVPHARNRVFILGGILRNGLTTIRGRPDGAPELEVLERILVAYGSTPDPDAGVR